MNKTVLKVLCALVGGGFAGLLVGHLIGMFIGGNFFPDFTYDGRRGYEATGTFGELIGAPLGALLCVWYVRRRKSPPSSLLGALESQKQRPMRYAVCRFTGQLSHSPHSPDLMAHPV